MRAILRVARSAVEGLAAQRYSLRHRWSPPWETPATRTSRARSPADHFEKKSQGASRYVAMPPGPPTEVKAWLDTLIPERTKEKLIYIEKVVRVPDAIPDLKEQIDLYRQAIYEVQESSSAFEAQRKREIRLEDRLREQESLPVPFAADYDQYPNGYHPGAANDRHPAWDGALLLVLLVPELDNCQIVLLVLLASLN